MRTVLVGLALVSLAACGDDDATSATSTTAATVPAASPAGSSAVTSAEPGGPATATDVAAVVCDDKANRMGADAEALTAESYQCTSGGEQARIDMYESDEQMNQAQQAVSDFYESTGDQRGLDELPVVCGERFSVGLDSNGQRDAVI